MADNRDGVACGRTTTVLSVFTVAPEPHQLHQPARCGTRHLLQVHVNKQFTETDAALLPLAGALLSSKRLSQAQ
jgi:hypothetical protein